jgi:hypothetical protein
MNYILRNQRAGRPITYVAGRTSENNRHVRAVVPVHRLVEELRPYVLQGAAIAAKNNIIESIILIILIKNKFCEFKLFSTIFISI